MDLSNTARLIISLAIVISVILAVPSFFLIFKRSIRRAHPRICRILLYPFILSISFIVLVYITECIWGFRQCERFDIWIFDVLFYM